MSKALKYGVLASLIADSCEFWEQRMCDKTLPFELRYEGAIALEDGRYELQQMRLMAEHELRRRK